MAIARISANKTTGLLSVRREVSPGSSAIGCGRSARPRMTHPMREIVAKGDMAVFIQVDDVDKTFESLRGAGMEILQEPIDQPYGVRDAAVRDPSGNHLRLSQPLPGQG